MTAARGQRRHDDGRSRPFGGTTAREIVAEALAKSEGWAEIRPGHWSSAGTVVAALKAAGWRLGARDRTEVTP